ncbi:MAG: hypothetical protein Tsb004_30560 [Allomuricauda sp.]
MKATLIIPITLSSAVFLHAQQGTVEDISTIYPQAFERAVKAKSATGIRALYVNGNVVLNVTLKSDGAAHYYFKSNAKDWAAMVEEQITAPYELRISEVDYEMVGDNFAISTARFDEYISGVHHADGYDLFTYVKTNVGWRINHMEVTLALDEAKLPEKEVGIYDATALQRVLLQMEQDFPGQDSSLIKFMEGDDQITINDFHNGVLASTGNYGLKEIPGILEGKPWEGAALDLGEPQIVDGHMAYVVGTLGASEVLLTLIHQNKDWLITAFHINR